MMGFLNFLKPPAMTSHDAVAWLRRQLPRGTRVGHLGTLDPPATGVLPLAVGAATRWIQFLPPARKSYRAELTFGLESDTLDTAGTILARRPAPRTDLEPLLQRMRGPQMQVPPVVSALRVEGRRSYERARAGESVEHEARAVEIYRLELVHEDWPRVLIDVDCSPGTYVRSLARDLGQQLGCGAVLSFLVRTASGPFRLEEAVTAEETPPFPLVGLETVLEGLPRVRVRPGLMPGQECPVEDPPTEGSTVVLFDPAFVGVGRIKNGQARLVRTPWQ